MLSVNISFLRNVWDVYIEWGESSTMHIMISLRHHVGPIDWLRHKSKPVLHIHPQMLQPSTNSNNSRTSYNIRMKDFLSLSKYNFSWIRHYFYYFFLFCFFKWKYSTTTHGLLTSSQENVSKSTFQQKIKKSKQRGIQDTQNIIHINITFFSTWVDCVPPTKMNEAI